jgi:hypothetical protein
VRIAEVLQCPHGVEVAKVSILISSYHCGWSKIRKCVFRKFHVFIRFLDFEGHCAHLQAAVEKAKSLLELQYSMATIVIIKVP